MDAETAVTVHRDVEYRALSDGSLALDVYRPDRDASGRAVVLLHGGGWLTGSKGELSRYALALVERLDAVVVDVDYRLADRATYPAQIEDVAAAVEWLRERAPELGVDPDRIATMGHSAGAHLAALAATPWTDGYDPASAFVGVSGAYDLTPQTDEEPVTELLGGTGEAVAERARAASPLYRIGDDPPAALLAHGSEDGVVDPGQSRAVRERLDDAGAAVELFVAEGGDHMIPHRNEWYDALVDRSEAFLRETL